MSFLTQLTRTSVRSLRTAPSVRPVTAGLHSSAVRNATGATRHENDPQVLERGKSENIEQHKGGVNAEWKEEVASDSEAFVKSVRNGGEPITQLQQDTVKKLKGKSREELNEPNSQS